MSAATGWLRATWRVASGARGAAGAGSGATAPRRRTDELSTFQLSTFDLYFIIDGKAAAPTISLHAHQPPPGHDPVRVSYPWAPMC